MRRVYIGNDMLELAEYIAADDLESYRNWVDPDTQAGFNFVMQDTYDEYRKIERRHRLFASIRLKETGEIIGTFSISPEGGPPDLAIWIHKPFRARGYGKSAFALGVRYARDVLGLGTLYAGCYPHNKASQRMLAGCGFVPHPEGNVEETHCLTGEPVTQYDYVLTKHE